MANNMFSNMDFGPFEDYLSNDDVTDISYCNSGQLHLKTLSKGIYRVESHTINNMLVEKLAFQCANVMGKTFNMATPTLDAEDAELRMNFVHSSIASNGVAVLMRKTPALIRLKKDKLLKEDYVIESVHDFIITCVQHHCNILVSGETGSGKTEFVKYLASHTKEDEKIITIEDTLELHLDKIYPTRDIIAMKTNNIAAYSDVLVTCMRQNPIWILLAEVRSAEAVMAVRNSISSGHHILSTIHSDKAQNIPMRLYSLLESNINIDQFLSSIHRYVQLGVGIRGYYSKERGRFQREIIEICEYYVDEATNMPKTNIIYSKTSTGKITLKNPSPNLINYLDAQGVTMDPHIFVDENNNIKDEINSKSDTNHVEDFNKFADDMVNTNEVDISNNVNAEIMNNNVEEVQQNNEIMNNNFNDVETMNNNINNTEVINDNLGNSEIME